SRFRCYAVVPICVTIRIAVGIAPRPARQQPRILRWGTPDSASGSPRRDRKTGLVVPTILLRFKLLDTTREVFDLLIPLSSPGGVWPTGNAADCCDRAPHDDGNNCDPCKPR